MIQRVDGVETATEILSAFPVFAHTLRQRKEFCGAHFEGAGILALGIDFQQFEPRCQTVGVGLDGLLEDFFSLQIAAVGQIHIGLGDRINVIGVELAGGEGGAHIAIARIDALATRAAKKAVGHTHATIEDRHVALRLCRLLALRQPGEQQQQNHQSAAHRQQQGVGKQTAEEAPLLDWGGLDDLRGHRLRHWRGRRGGCGSRSGHRRRRRLGSRCGMRRRSGCDGSGRAGCLGRFRRCRGSNHWRGHGALHRYGQRRGSLTCHGGHGCRGYGGLRFGRCDGLRLLGQRAELVDIFLQLLDLLFVERFLLLVGDLLGLLRASHLGLAQFELAFSLRACGSRLLYLGLDFARHLALRLRLGLPAHFRQTTAVGVETLALSQNETARFGLRNGLRLFGSRHLQHAARLHQIDVSVDEGRLVGAVNGREHLVERDGLHARRIGDFAQGVAPLDHILAGSRSRLGGRFFRDHRRRRRLQRGRNRHRRGRGVGSISGIRHRGRHRHGGRGRRCGGLHRHLSRCGSALEIGRIEQQGVVAAQLAIGPLRTDEQIEKGFVDRAVGRDAQIGAPFRAALKLDPHARKRTAVMQLGGLKRIGRRNTHLQ